MSAQRGRGFICFTEVAAGKSMYNKYKQVHQARKISQLGGSALRCTPGLSKGRCASALWLQWCGTLRPRWAHTRVTKGPQRGPAESAGAAICSFASGSLWLSLCAGLLCATRGAAGRPGHGGVRLQGSCASGLHARPARTATGSFYCKMGLQSSIPNMAGQGLPGCCVAAHQA